MERVAIIGPGGAGKTEVATTLGRRLGLPIVHLDPIFWREAWTPAPRDDAVRALEDAVARDSWILDGNFLDYGEERFRRADTVIFLDLPRRTCLRRVLWRRVRDRGRARADLPKGAREGFDPALLRWIWNYGRTDRPRVLELLDRLAPHVDVHHLRSPRDVRRFLGSL